MEQAERIRSGEPSPVIPAAGVAAPASVGEVDRA
jgi:hypothetical protein